MKKYYVSVVLALLTLFSWGQEFPFPQNVEYEYGIQASTPDNNRIQSLYTKWKNNFYTESGDYARIKFDDQQYTVSEGTAYGMLIFVYMDNSTNNTQDEFDKSYNYYQKFSSQNSGGKKYLMEWKIQGFSNVNLTGSASDADFDVALALLLAHKQWGSNGDINYIKEAETLLDVIYQKQVRAWDHIIKPGHHWEDAANPCYFTTASIGLYTQAQDAEGFSKTHDWTKVYDAAQTYLKNSQSSAGLWPDWTSPSVTSPSACKPGGGGCNWSWDACRTSWRIAWDYIWYGTANSKTMCDKTAELADTKNPSTLSVLNLQGSPAEAQYANSAFTGGMGAAYMTGTNQSQLDTWYNVLKNKNEGAYYGATIQVLYLLTMSGNMPNFYANSAPTAPRFVSAETSTDGTKIYISVNKPLKDPASSNTSKFSLKINGATKSGAVTEIKLLSPTIIQLTLSASTTFEAVDELTISYASGNIVSEENLALEAFTNESVSNELPGNNTMLDNCENDATLTNLGSFWYGYADKTSTLFVGSTQIMEGDPFMMTKGGANGTDSAAVVKGRLAVPEDPEYESAGIGFAFTSVEPKLNASNMVTNVADVAYDITGATEITFYHKGDAIFFCIMTTDTKQNSGHDYIYEVPEHTSWTLVTIDLAAATQASWLEETTDFNLSKVLKLQWQVKDGDARNYEFGIDEVTLEGVVLDLEPPVNKADLEDAIADAQDILDAAEVGSGDGEFPQSAKDDLEDAIEAAQEVYDNENASQLEVSAATEALKDAVKDFEESVIGTNKTALTAAIKDAQDVIDDATVGTAVGDYPKAAYDAFEDAIADAIAIKNSSSVSQDEVDQAVEDLEAAQATFEASKIKPVATSTILSDCEDANQTYFGTYWFAFTDVDVAGASKITHPTSIDPFGMSLGGADGTDSALRIKTTLDQGEWDYDPFIGFGFNTTDPEGGTFDLSAGDGISFYHKGDQVTVSAFIPGVGDGPHGYTVPESSSWQLVEIDWEEFMQPSWYADQIEFDASQIEKFQWQVQGSDGNYEVWIDEVKLEGGAVVLPGLPNAGEVVVDKDALEAAIDAANTLLNSSEPGNAPGEYPTGDYNAFEDAIQEAEDVFADDAATQEEVDDAVTALESAQKDFEDSVIEGAVIDYADLEDLIAEAKTLSNTNVGTKPGQHPTTAKNTLVAAIGDAEDLVDNATSQGQVTVAIDELQDAMDAFEADVNPDPNADTELADAESGNATQFGTYWFAYSSGESTIKRNEDNTLLKEGDPFYMSSPGADGTDSAAVVNGDLVNTGDPDYESAGIGFATQGVDPTLDSDGMVTNIDDVVFDLTGVTDISFYHKGAALNFCVITSDTKQDAGHDYACAVDEHSNWTLVTVPVADLAQESWVSPQVDLDLSKVMKFQWQVKGGEARDYEFGIDEVKLLGASIKLPGLPDVDDPVVSADKDALEAAIEEANDFNDLAEIGNAPGEYPLAASMAFENAIAAAEAVFEDDAATQTEVDDAVEALEEALAEFKAAKKPEIVIDYSDLEDLIAEAVELSDENVGSLPGQHPDNAQLKLLSAITDAREFIEADNATSQAQVTDAIEDLQDAMDTFKADVNPAPDKSDLEDAIQNAEDFVADAVVGTDEGEYPKADKEEMEDAIADANKVLADKDATQAQVDSAIEDLKDALDKFADSVVPEADVDYADLEDLIAEAKTLSNTNVGTKPGQHPTIAKNTLVAAIGDAEDLVDNAASQAQVDLAVSTLQDAMDAFEANVNPAPDKSDLEDAIQDAEDFVADAVVGTDEGQYSQADKDAMEDAIADANDVLNDKDATQDEIDSALEDLNDASDKFADSANPPSSLDKSDLEDLIGQAQELHDGATAGTDEGEYPLVAKNAFKAAITTAESTLDAAKTQAQLDAAYNNLAKAMQTFQKNQIGGATVDKDALIDEIANANSALAKAEEGSGDGQYPVGSKGNLEAAIETAQSVANSATATQGEVDAAKDVLTDALGEFANSVIGVDKSELTKIIAEANELYDDSEEGSLPGQYPTEDLDDFQRAIRAANAVLVSSGSSQTSIDYAVKDLEEAIKDFKATVISDGTVDKTELDAKIAEAEAIYGSAQIGLDDGQYPLSAVTVFYSAIQDARSTYMDSHTNQAAVNYAIEDLEDAIEFFYSQVNGGVVGLEDADATLTVYPNPAVDVLNITAGQEIKTVSIVSIVGTPEVTEEVGADSVQLAVAHLANGVYFVQVNYVDGTVETIKVTKR